MVAAKKEATGQMVPSGKGEIVTSEGLRSPLPLG